MALARNDSPLTDIEIKQRFQVFAQQYNLIINMIHNLNLSDALYARIADHFDDAYVWSEKAFGILSVQAIEREKVKIEGVTDSNVEPHDAA